MRASRTAAKAALVDEVLRVFDRSFDRAFDRAWARAARHARKITLAAPIGPGLRPARRRS